MRILFVAASESVHSVRWINQVTGQGWDIHLFDSGDSGYVNPLLRDTTVYHSLYRQQPRLDPSVRLKGIRLPFGVTRSKKLLGRLRPGYRTRHLAQLIQRLQPDIVHSLELQHSAYLTWEARQMLPDFPTWIVTNWGSDIQLFGRLKDHREKIRAILQAADYYDCECQRDIHLAQELGMTAAPLPVLPNAGGLDMAQLAALRTVTPPSSRRVIVMKGYQNWSGRALYGLRALELCADVLQGYRVVVYSPWPLDDMPLWCQLLSEKVGIPVDILPWGQPHETILRQFAQARVYLGLSISDGISTSMLEAIALGAFPVQSNTACADEWVTDGESGLLVPPEDPHLIAEALRRALTDDVLVDQAAEINARTCAERLDATTIRQQVITIYERIRDAKSRK